LVSANIANIRASRVIANEADQRLAADRLPADRPLPDRVVGWISRMKIAVFMIFGIALMFGFPGATYLIAALGALAGCGLILAEAKWPKSRAAYIEPVNRPRAMKPASLYLQAGIVAAVSCALILITVRMVMPRFPATSPFMLYLASAGVGMAAGMVLTARQVSESHNRWLESMTPRASLDFGHE
jgi:hypothetical protein